MPFSQRTNQNKVIMYSKLEDIKTSLWGKFNLHFKANDDVNIIVGINGSGKTTLLNEIHKIALNNIDNKNLVVFVPSIDNIAMRDKRKVANALTQDLEFYMFDMKTGPSMMYHRMSMIDASPEKQAEMKASIDDFCAIINKLFSDTGKRIEIEGNKFNIVAGDQLLPINALSSGEKQILLILVLIDEPENSLDISWQFELINILVKLNPNAQYFITTHSPSIFGKGWGDKIIYMEDITTPVNTKS